MKAYVIHHYGSDSKFELIELPTPAPAANEVLIKVEATSVNPIDIKIRQGLVPAFSPACPAVLHGDVSGTVTAIGNEVQGFQEGDKVYACGGGVKGSAGALAEYMPVDCSLVAHRPKSLNAVEAASLPLVSITAWMGLYDRAKISGEEKVLVHAGCGGVGHIALQLAKLKGCHVTTTVSDESKAAICKSLGADEVILYKTESVEEYLQRLTESQGYDVVMDTVGGENLDRSFRAVKQDGQVVAVAARSTHDLTPLHAKGTSLHIVMMLSPIVFNKNRAHLGNILKQISQAVDEGNIKPLVDKRVFDMDAINEAHEYLLSGAAVGKVVVRW